MKFIKGISLFIAIIGIFLCGCFLGSLFQRFFYPGKNAQEYIRVSHMEKQVITADTQYVVVSVNELGNNEEIQQVPAQYIGMDLDAFTQTIDLLNESPSLSELRKGFQGAQVHSFSREKVELYKYYATSDDIPTQEYYYLALQEGKVVVLLSDEKTIYMETDIDAESLPDDILFDLLQKRVVNTQGLYDFLESYTS